MRFSLSSQSVPDADPEWAAAEEDVLMELDDFDGDIGPLLDSIDPARDKLDREFRDD